MRSFHAVRSLALAVLLGGALMTSSCTAQPAGVGLGFTTPSPWNATPQMEITTTWDGGPMYWSP